MPSQARCGGRHKTRGLVAMTRPLLLTRSVAVLRLAEPDVVSLVVLMGGGVEGTGTGNHREVCRAGGKNRVPVGATGDVLGLRGDVVRDLTGSVVELRCIAGLEVSCAPEDGRAGAAVVAAGAVDVAGDNQVAGSRRTVVAETTAEVCHVIRQDVEIAVGVR